MRSLALRLRWNPQLGNFLAYVVAVATGYVLHSRWSFRDHGGETDPRDQIAFAIVSLISYALNELLGLVTVRPILRGPTLAADRADAVRHPGGDLRPQSPMGVPLMERRRLRTNGRARPAPLVVSRPARGPGRSDPPRGAGRRPARRFSKSAAAPGTISPCSAGFGQVDALELDDEAREIAESRLGKPVMSAPLPQLKGVQTGHYDLIGAFDVIEHIADDHAAMLSIAKRLKPGGKLVMTVPAHQWMWSAHDVVNHHVRRYSKRPLQRLIEASRFGSKRSAISIACCSRWRWPSAWRPSCAARTKPT